MKATISSRHGLGPDHNLWNNHGTWWAHFTVHLPDHTKERIRVSLGTKDLAEARRRRDLIMSGTPAIAARIPRPPGQAKSDIPMPAAESRAARNPHGHGSGAMTHRKFETETVPC